MAHSKCRSCRARVWRDGSSTSDLCPGCGGPLEAVTELSELIGYKCLRARPKGPSDVSTERSERISQQIREQIARHDAERQHRVDA